MSDATVIETTPAPAMGHNLRFIEIDGFGNVIVALDAMREWLIGDQADLMDRRTRIVEGFDRAPTVVLDEETHKRMADFAKTILTFCKDAKADHDARKAPWLAGGGLIDNRWHELADEPARAKTEIERRMKVYADKKAEIERRARQEEARRQAAEAERRRREAEAAEQAMLAKQEPDHSDLDDAIAAEQAAREAEQRASVAQRAAEAKPAELARTRSDLGAVATLARVWKFHNLDRATIDLNALRSHLTTECIEKALRSYINAGGRTITGATIYEDTRQRVT